MIFDKFISQRTWDRHSHFWQNIRMPLLSPAERMF